MWDLTIPCTSKIAPFRPISYVVSWLSVVASHVSYRRRHPTWSPSGEECRPDGFPNPEGKRDRRKLCWCLADKVESEPMPSSTVVESQAPSGLVDPDARVPKRHSVAESDPPQCDGHRKTVS